MTSTPVGMRCPECASQRTQVRNPIGAAGRSDAPATYALIAINVVAFSARSRRGDGGGGGTLTRGGALFAYGIDAAGQTPGSQDGEWYRLVTSGFLHAGVLHIGLNMFALYILGTLLEPAIGTVRFVAIYFVSLLCRVVRSLLLDPEQLTVGASGGDLRAHGRRVPDRPQPRPRRARVADRLLRDPQPGVHLRRPATSASAATSAA